MEVILGEKNYVDHGCTRRQNWWSLWKQNKQLENLELVLVSYNLTGFYILFNFVDVYLIIDTEHASHDILFGA